MNPAILVGVYLWDPGKPVPNCDSCGKSRPEYKVMGFDSGLRLCKECLIILHNKIGIALAVKDTVVV